VVEQLSDEFDVMDVALAAVKLAHESGTVEVEEEEIPEAPRATGPSSDRPARQSGPGGKPSGPRRTLSGDSTKLFVGLGRAAGMRPQDLVGAITGESSLSGRDIGGIEISERFSLVEIPTAAADEVIAALKATQLKGRKATVRREKFEAR
jgi:ATP-dependent RNA helicase DeaD